MPSWFTKLFDKNDTANQRDDRPSFPTGSEYLDMVMDEDTESAPERRVVRAPVLDPVEDDFESPKWFRIKAAILSPTSCRFMVERPVVEGGYSLVVLGPESMHKSPLAEALFDLGRIEAVIIHGANVTVARSPEERGDWKPLATAIGARIRSHLEAGRPCIAHEYLNELPSESAIRERLEKALDQVINPGIAAHSGYIQLDRVEGNTAYIEMQGGCQGCAASQMTLRDGVEQIFREAVPQLGLILDVTDHEAGTNPFYASMPTDEG